MKIGVTGHFGYQVVQDLLKQGVAKGDIVGLARTPSHAQSLSSAGIALRRADFDDVKTLNQALVGIDRLLLVSTREPDPNIRTTQQPKLSATNWLIVAYIVVGGTMFAYPFFLQSTRYISPAVTSISGSFEPLIATVLAVTLLGTRLTVATVIGSLLILFTTFLQSIPVNRINYLIHRKVRG